MSIHVRELKCIKLKCCVFFYQCDASIIKLFPRFLCRGQSIRLLTALYTHTLHCIKGNIGIIPLVLLLFLLRPLYSAVIGRML